MTTITIGPKQEATTPGLTGSAHFRSLGRLFTSARMTGTRGDLLPVSPGGSW